MERKSKEISEYERERLKRIEENRKMLSELFPNGTGLNGGRMGRRERAHTPEEGSESGGSLYGSPIRPLRNRCVCVCVCV